MTEPRLEKLSTRIERLSQGPDEVSAPLVRLARPLLSRIGWQPRVTFDRFPALMTALSSYAKSEGGARDVSGLLDEAIVELEANVVAVERATVVNQRALLQHAAWLGRIASLLRRAGAFIEQKQARDERLLLAHADSVAYLPPLAPRLAPETAAHAWVEAEAPPKGQVAIGCEASPLVELQLSVVDRLVEAARAEGELLARRRRLLEGARRSLLDVAAAMPLDPAGVEQRQRYIAGQIARIDRIEAAGVVGGVRLVHQARKALQRGETKQLCAGLFAIRETALSRGDALEARLATTAIARLFDGDSRDAAERVEASQRASADELLGPRVVAAVLRGYQLAREPGRFKTDYPSIQERVDRYLEPGAELATLRAMLAVDGCCEVGGSLSPVRVEEIIERQVAVRFPTQRLVLLPAESIADIPDAVVDDPRTILMSLAAGRLLARRFVQSEQVVQRRIVLQGEVRVFLLDGSGSMIGTRARVRDAILLAELASLSRRAAEHGRHSRVVIYYRYFSDVLGPVTKVSSAREAIDAIVDVASTMRQGDTNLEAALLACYEQIQQARADDPDLSRAQIVLITDGEAPIDMGKVDAARQAVAGMPVAISVITLGQENELLRGLVAAQRAQGERAFYHHLEDSLLVDIERGSLEGGPALHLPPELFADMAPSQKAEALASSVGGLLDELATLERTRDIAAIEQAMAHDEALTQVGLGRSALTQAERARLELLHQDKRGLTSRFDRWFPAGGPNLAAPPHDDAQRATEDRLVIMLSAVADIAELGGSELSRQHDAIEVLERLLPDAGLTPSSYEGALAVRGASLAKALAAVRHAVRPQPVR